MYWLRGFCINSEGKTGKSMRTNKLKILFITRNRSKRGGHIVLTSLVRELRKQGYDVSLVAFRPKGEVDFPECEELWKNIQPDIISIPFSLNAEEQILHYTNYAAKYLQKNEKNFDRIILDSWHIAHAAIKSGIVSKKVFHLVQSDPEFFPEDYSKIWKSELFSLLPLIPIRRIVVSNSLASLFEKRYRKRYDVVELFVDDIFFQVKFKCLERKRLRFISSSGDFNVPTKGLDFLLNQLKKIKKYPFELTLVSGGQIKKKLGRFPFKINITTTSTRKAMADLLSNHDIYINTSTKETFCLALAEALAVGMPSIAVDSVGNREYMDGKNAIFIKNPKDFSGGLEKLFELKFRKKLSRKAKESMKKYRIENTVNNFKKIIAI
jgi:glycosyltransferase involved in cell wall biosynthesis